MRILIRACAPFLIWSLVLCPVNSANILETIWGIFDIVSLPTLLPLPNVLRTKSPIVNITNGLIQGRLAKSRDGREYWEYLGIPFAKPPIGDLRFMPPEPYTEKWSEVKLFQSHGEICPQSSIEGYGQEDCLTLNVFQPIGVKSSRLLPVMVWIHGGAFTGGSNNMYRAKYMMDENIILVVIQYRLGALGFLSTGDGVIGGNMGLRDQIQSLRWVQDNIQNFNGNPNEVTIFGESAGKFAGISSGSSVHYLVISPLAKGLFKRAIAQSGTAINWLAFTKDPYHQAKRFAKKFNCSTNKSEEILACLRKVDYKQLVGRHDGVSYTPPPKYDAFLGTVDAIKEGAFLPEEPIKMIKKGNFNRVSLLIGINAGEGGLLTSSIESSPIIRSIIKENWYSYSSVINDHDIERIDIANKILNYFFGETPGKDPGQNLRNLTRLISESLFWNPALRSAKYHAKYAPTRMYFYNYTSTVPLYPISRGASGPNAVPQALDLALLVVKKGILSKLSFFLDLINLKFSSQEFNSYGPTHGDEVLMLFDPFGIQFVSAGSMDYQFSKMLVKTWTNFALHEINSSHFAVDELSWPKITNDDPTKYVVLDTTPKVVHHSVLTENIMFWREVYNKSKEEDE